MKKLLLNFIIIFIIAFWFVYLFAAFITWNILFLPTVSLGTRAALIIITALLSVGIFSYWMDNK